MNGIAETKFQGPVLDAAEKALATGAACHILVWVPAGTENMVKNLLEKACCERTISLTGECRAADGYFRTVLRLHSAHCGLRNLNYATRTPQEREIIRTVESACRSGDYQEIGVVLGIYKDTGVRERFCEVLERRDYPAGDIGAGRRYTTAFVDLVALVISRCSGSRDQVPA